MARTNMLVRFNEAHDYEKPVDEAGNVLPFAAPSGLAMPTSVDGIVGRARRFSPSQGLISTEVNPGAAPTRLTRDLTIEVIASIPWVTTNGTYRLVTRGRGNSVGVGEREAWGLQVVVSGAPAAPVVQLQMRWETAAGAAATVPAVTIAPPAGWLSLAATRRWISDTSVVVDYYANGEFVGQVTSADGALSEGLAASLLIGTSGALVGMPSGAVIDDVRITSDARSAQELRQIYRRSFVYPSFGYDLIRSLLPPGDSWSANEDSRIQRFFKVAGDGLATAWAKAGELLDDFLPDRAWSLLDRWESVLRLSSKYGDTIEARRARVIAFIRKVHGYSKAQILEGLVELLDVAHTTDLEFIEKDNFWSDPFTAGSLASRWLREPGTSAMGFAPTSGKLDIDFASGKDARWDGTNRNAARLRTSIPAGDDFELAATLSAISFVMDGASAGVYVLNANTNDALLYGVKRISGFVQTWARTIIGGVVTDYFGSGAGVAPIVLRLRRTADGLAQLSYSSALITDYNANTWTTDIASVPAPAGALWCGAFLSADTNPTTGTNGVDLSEFYLRDFDDPHVFEWMVFRDPALGGAPDIGAARQVIEKTKPAHTSGGITQARVALYDNALTGYDSTPLGG